MLIDGTRISSHVVQDDENKVCVMSNRASVTRRAFPSEPSYMIAETPPRGRRFGGV